jgi:mono/diheme cytochrome c family protein
VRILGLILAVAGLIVGSLAAYVYLTSPRMYVQPHIRAYQTNAPLLPEGVVPVNAWPKLPSEEEARTLVSPVQASAETRAWGKTYYQYYCVFCHGELGDGNGPVGHSYVPKPADLRAPKIQAYADGQICRTMLTGTGHEPVLDKVVLPEHRWYLVQYVRELGASVPK